MMRIPFLLGTSLCVLLASSCAPEVVRFAHSEKSDHLQMANHVSAYLLSEAYNVKVDMVNTDDASGSLHQGKVDVALETPTADSPDNADVLGQLYEGSATVKAASKELRIKNQKVYDFIKSMKYPKEKLEWSVDWMRSKQQPWSVGATHFVNSNQTKWKKWGLTESETGAVKKKLEKDVAELINQKIF